MVLGKATRSMTASYSAKYIFYSKHLVPVAYNANELSRRAENQFAPGSVFWGIKAYH